MYSELVFGFSVFVEFEIKIAKHLYLLVNYFIIKIVRQMERSGRSAVGRKSERVLSKISNSYETRRKI